MANRLSHVKHIINVVEDLLTGVESLSGLPKLNSRLAMSERERLHALEKRLGSATQRKNNAMAQQQEDGRMPKMDFATCQDLIQEHLESKY